MEELRRLFWARLMLREPSARQLVFSTAHFTWEGHAEEARSDRNIRKANARATVDALGRVLKHDGKRREDTRSLAAT